MYASNVASLTGKAGSEKKGSSMHQRNWDIEGTSTQASQALDTE
jgi:hypothetical protein